MVDKLSKEIRKIVKNMKTYNDSVEQLIDEIKEITIQKVEKKKIREAEKILAKVKRPNPLIGKKQSYKSIQKRLKTLKGKKIKYNHTNNPFKKIVKNSIKTNHYDYIHRWVHKMWGKANKCDISDAHKTSHHFEWANISGHYLLREEDWIRLCKSCHFFLDFQKYSIQDLKDKEQKRLEFINAL